MERARPLGRTLVAVPRAVAYLPAGAPRVGVARARAVAAVVDDDDVDAPKCFVGCRVVGGLSTKEVSLVLLIAVRAPPMQARPSWERQGREGRDRKTYNSVVSGSRLVVLATGGAVPAVKID